MSNVQTITDSSFESGVVNSDIPVLVDFWAPWCAPCRVVGPVLEQIATEYEGLAKVVKVNVDEEQAVAGSLGVRSIPTIALFEGGKVRDTLIGAHPKEEFKSLLEKYITSE
jgi:thioredoxin 1